MRVVHSIGREWLRSMAIAERPMGSRELVEDAAMGLLATCATSLVDTLLNNCFPV